MNVEGKEEKLIIKGGELQGVRMGRADFGMFSTVQPSWAEVTKAMWKVGRNTYIGVNGYANTPGDIIKVGRLHKLYRIIKFVRREGTRMGKGGDIIMVKRVDGNPTTSVDITNIAIGDSVKILNKKTFIEKLDIPEYRDYVEPCRDLPTRIIPCDKRCEC